MTNNALPLEIIQSRIYVIRGKKTMLDRDLASLYGVETRVLNQAVKRNIARFPDDFMFSLSREEIQGISQIVISSEAADLKFSSKVTAFTEQGIAMLSGILSSSRAIQVNIQIMRTFTKMREMLMNYQELKDKIENMEQKYDTQFKSVFDAIKLLISNDQEIHKRLTYEEEIKRDTQFGFRPNKK